jgi:hypothetical protein
VSWDWGRRRNIILITDHLWEHPLKCNTIYGCISFRIQQEEMRHTYQSTQGEWNINDGRWWT